MHRTKSQQEAHDQLTREIAVLDEINKNARVLFDAHNHEAAAALFRRCAKTRPENPVYTVNYGSALWNIGEYAEAERVLKYCVEQWPRYEAAHDNYAKTIVSFRRYDEAEAIYRNILSWGRDKHRTQLQRAFCRLQRGDWERGLEDYESRREINDYQKFPLPEWYGEDLNGKTLYVQSEQGSGDTILFSRYLWWVKAKWPTCTIKFCCTPTMVQLLWNYQARGKLTFVPANVPWSDIGADYGTYLASLPRIHGTRLDNIPVDPGLIEQRCVAQEFQLGKPELGNPLKVGICWTGNPSMAENPRRILPVKRFLRMSSDPRWMFYSLQVGQYGRDQLYELMGQESIGDLANMIEPRGWIGTGAAMSKLDLVITCCTSVAHMAGAMGVRTWLLLHREPYWVWGNEGTTTPWYPSLQLFRQPDFGDWDSVFKEVEAELDKLAGDR